MIGSSSVSASAITPFLTELHSLGSIPPGTFFHRNRNGHFIATADSASCITGAQTLANSYKGRDPAETALQIAEFSKQLQEQIKANTLAAVDSLDEVLCRKSFRQLIFVCQKINYAIRGRVEGGGLGGAPKTYSAYGDAGKLIETAVDAMKEIAFNSLKSLRDQLPEREMLGDEQLVDFITYSHDLKEKPYCPEEDYCDEEWETAIAQSSNLRKESIGMLQYYGRYSIGLFYNQTRSYVSSFSGESDTGWDWMNKIGHFEDGDLYLSALPITSPGTDSLKDMKKENIGAVLSVTEVFETLSDGYLTNPIKPHEYAENGIKHLQIPSPDCETIFFELVMRGVEFVHWCLSKGISVDVHCKAGRGRSFLIVLCYLIKYRNMTAEAAFEHVKLMRPQAGFSKKRAEWKTAKLFEKFYYTPPEEDIK